MKNNFLSACFFLIATLIQSQSFIEINNSHENDFEYEQISSNELEIDLNINHINYEEIVTAYGAYLMINVDGFNNSKDIGKPTLPVLSKLIEIPFGTKYSWRVVELQYEIIELDKYKIDQLIYPAQLPISKCAKEDDLKAFSFDQEIYRTDANYGSDMIRITDLGFMRDVNIGRLEVAPILYNPVKNTLLVYHKLHIKISFTEDTEIVNSKEYNQNYFSPFFEGLFKSVINHDEFNEKRELITSSPATFIIVSDPIFESELQEFINWKIKKGFRVVEAYTDNPEVGNTTTSIKAYLENFYNNPPEDYLPQSYVLIVGDVPQVPAFLGTTGGHSSDFFYAEYTGDFLPDCIIGRFSANNIAELTPQISKSIEYEKYELPQTSYLNHALLVAGVDGSHNDWSNGQINYAVTYYFNEEHGITPHVFLQPFEPEWYVHDSIMYWLNHGVMFGNYTAHCNALGWSNPSFTVNDISALEENHRYPLLVGNCCSSSAFNQNCFGEVIVRAPFKGALAYIGGSDNTYWDEDYWWSVGFKDIVQYPLYDPEALGAFDRTFHDFDEPLEEWFVTQGQMVSAGNLAVTQSGSSLDDYYWEVYHLFGDPSIMVYYSEPDAMIVGLPESLPLVASEFNVISEPYSYIAISMGGVLHGTGIADEDGNGTVTLFESFTEAGTAEVVVTGQNFEPYFGFIDIVSPTGPYVLIDDYDFDDASGNNNGLVDYNESISINVSLHNYGASTATSLTAVLSTEDINVNITDNEETCPDIIPGEAQILNNAFSLDVNSLIEDGHIVDFNLTVSDGIESWTSGFNMTLHAPEFALSDFAILDETGDGEIAVGESAELIFNVTNIGSSLMDEFTAGIEVDSEDVTILNGPMIIESLEAGATTQISFEISTSETTPDGTIAIFDLSLNSVIGYSLSEQVNVLIGVPPVLIVDVDPNHNSAIAMKGSMISKGVAARIIEEFPDDLSAFEAVFVCLGIYNSTHVLNQNEGQTLANYLNNGGNIYMEGGETWNFDVNTPVHPMFNIDGTDDGSGDIEMINGINGTFSQGLNINYLGENSFIDRLEATEPAYLLLMNSNPLYGLAVANDMETYKTIGASFEFGGLNQSDSQNDEYMERVLNFFGLTGHENLIAYFSVSTRFPQPGVAVDFVNLSLGDIISYVWTFEGGNPSASIEQNPSVIFPISGDFDVTLTVEDGFMTQTYFMDNYMHVSVGVEELSATVDVNIYPNPIDDYMVIELNLVEASNVKIDILDLTGQLLETIIDVTAINSGKHLFPYKSVNLESGIYFCRIYKDDQYILKKIIVQ